MGKAPCLVYSENACSQVGPPGRGLGDSALEKLTGPQRNAHGQNIAMLGPPSVQPTLATFSEAHPSLITPTELPVSCVVLLP